LLQCHTCATNHRKLGKKNESQIVFIDIKSQWLGDLLSTLLRDVDGVSLKDDRPSVGDLQVPYFRHVAYLQIERNVLYHFLPVLETYAKSTLPEASESLEHLNLLIHHMRGAYASTNQRLATLLDNGEITFDLLWAIFKPNTPVHGSCLGTDKPRCIKYSFGEQRITKSGNEYFHIEGRYLDFDGQQFGEATTALGIYRFRGVKRINSLDAFPLEYHEETDTEKKNLEANGRKFVKFKNIHHRYYEGNAFCWEKGEIDKISVHGRIIIDPTLFREINPNYERPRVDKIRANNSRLPYFISNDWFGDASPKSDGLRGKNNDADVDLTEDNLLFCSPTVLGFSLDRKKWRKLLVSLCVNRS
jgi:hypothetical protein